MSGASAARAADVTAYRLAESNPSVQPTTRSTGAEQCQGDRVRRPGQLLNSQELASRLRAQIDLSSHHNTHRLSPKVHAGEADPLDVRGQLDPIDHVVALDPHDPLAIELAEQSLRRPPETC